MVKRTKTVERPPPTVSHDSPEPNQAPKLLPPLDDGLGARIRQVRDARGWTQVQLSTRTRLCDPESKGIARTVIVGYEAGTYRPGAREIKLLCEALHVTPNWLLFGQENPFAAMQPSVALVGTRREMDSAVRLALAILLLKPHERSTISSLVLSLGGREVGDARLAGMAALAGYATDAIIKELGEWVGGAEAAKNMSAREFIDQLSRAMEGNVGTKLKFNESTEEWEGDWLYPDPG